MNRFLAPAVALALTFSSWVVADADEPTSLEVERAASGLAFERHNLPTATDDRKMRTVAPALDPIRPWISAVGASVGVVDLRGQGFAGDACLTDPRDDTVKVFSVPGSSGEPFPTFELAATGLRYDASMAPIGCVPSDINQDGAYDFIIYYWGRSPVVFVNRAFAGPPTAEGFQPVELVSPMEVWNTTALNVADVDGDAALDVLVGNYFPDGARVLDPDAVGDDRMAMQHSMGKARNAGPNRLFLGSSARPGKAPTFFDVSNRLPAESARSWTLAIGFQDLTGNGLPDAYVANDFGPDQLLVNTSEPGDVRLTVVRGDRDLTTARSKVLGHDSFKGMGVAYSYRNGEALPDIVVSNITSTWALQESNFAFLPAGEGEDLLDGVVPYEERSTESGLAHSGWSWDVKAVDLQNRGRDDLVQATGFIQGDRNIWPRLQETAMGNDLILEHPEAWLRIEPGDDLSGHEVNRLWRWSDGRYVDVGSAVPFDDSEVSRGIAPADINGDGLYDLLVANQWQDSFAYVNRSESDNAWLTINVVREASRGSTPVIGAQVEIAGGGYSRRAQLYPANGHSGVGDAALHFGLPHGLAPADVTATVRWVDAKGTHDKTFSVRPGIQTLRVE